MLDAKKNEATVAARKGIYFIGKNLPRLLFDTSYLYLARYLRELNRFAITYYVSYQAALENINFVF